MNYCAGVDLGGTNIAIGIIDLDSKNIVEKGSVKTNAPRPCEEICKDIKKLICELCAKQKIEVSDLKWVGAAAPGIVKDGVVVSAVNLEWENVDFGKLLSKEVGVKAFIANDANAAAYAEAMWGSGKGANSVVAVTIGTGVGGGIIVNGKIWEGCNGFAAELGHITIDMNGRKCGCGRRGCLEAYCSASALVKESERITRLYPESLMVNMMRENNGKMNGIIPFAAKRQGDMAANIVVNDFIEYLATGVASIINIFQPEIVCIGGGISGEGDYLLLPLRDRVNHISLGTKETKTKLAIAKYRNDAGIIGAGLLGLMEEN